MDFEIKKLSSKHEDMWDDFVLNNDNATFYHQIGWKKVVENTYGHKSYYFFAENSSGEIIGILPMFYLNSPFVGKRFVSVPFSSYGGVCTNFDFVAKALVNNIIDVSNEINADHCEFRDYKTSYYSDAVNGCDSYCTFILNLSEGSEYIWNNMNRKVRNRIRKGDKNGLEFEIDSDLESISEFYNLYALNMKSLGTPVHDINFFKNLAKAFPKQVLVSKSILNATSLSALFLLKFKDTLISGWGASNPTLLKYAPNDFMYWNSINYASAHDFSHFDFGRSLSTSGTKRFKERWGAIEVPLWYWYSPSSYSQELIQKEYGKFAKVWSKLPLSLTKKMGPKIRRHVP